MPKKMNNKKSHDLKNKLKEPCNRRSKRVNIGDLEKKLTMAQKIIVELINDQSVLTVAQLKLGIIEEAKAEERARKATHVEAAKEKAAKRLAAALDTINELKSNRGMRMTDTYRKMIRYHNL